jgi:hypothetical protein
MFGVYIQIEYKIEESVLAIKPVSPIVFLDEGMIS